MIIKIIICVFINTNIYICLFIKFLKKLIKFFIIIKIVILGIININIYMYLYIFGIKIFIYYDILFL